MPVIRSRKLVLYSLIVFDRREFSFLILCASSMIIYRQLNRRNIVFSLMAISKLVTQTSKFPATSNSSRMYLYNIQLELTMLKINKKYNIFFKKGLYQKHTRSSGFPRNFTARRTGQKRRISFIQLPSVDFGATTM